MRYRFKRRSTRLTVLVVCLLGLSAAGIAYAVIPDSNGVIHGCFKNNNGALRVIDPGVSSCASGEMPIQWNASGPSGPSGASGPSGPPGPSSAQSARAGFIALAGDGDADTYTTLATLNLAAGAYVIEAKTVIADDLDSDATYVVCRLDANNPADSDLALTMISPGTRRAVVSLFLPHTFTSSGSVTLACQPSNPPDEANVGSEFTWITAIKVGSETH
jgi:hypothetical protein